MPVANLEEIPKEFDLLLVLADYKHLKEASVDWQLIVNHAHN